MPRPDRQFKAAMVIGFCLACAPVAADSPEPWGLRLRPVPASMAKVRAPVVVRESPGNEASVVRLPDNTLRVYYIARPMGKELRSIASIDGGLTWTDDRLEFRLPGVAYHALEVLVDRHGELQAAFHIFRGEGRQPGIDRNLDVWHARTTGNRTQWAPPQRIFEGYVGAIRGLLQLKSGRLLLPFARAVPERLQTPPAGEPDFGWNNVVILASDDDGAHWKRMPQELKITLCGPNTTRYGAIEPNVTQLADGRVWMLIRDRCGRLYESYSADDGGSWTEPAKTQFITSDSPAWTLRLADGRLVLFWCACQRWDNPRSYAMGGREVLHAAISRDDGQTWRGFREVLVELAEPAARGDRGAAYPTAAENEDGKIVLAAGQGEGRKAIVLLDPDWLEETSARDNFAEGLVHWTAYGAGAVKTVDHPDARGAKMLQIRRTDPQAPAGATWNFPAARSGTLTMRMRVQGGFTGARITLTDHFSVIADMQAAQNAVFSANVEPEAGSHVLTFNWRDDSAELRLDDRLMQLAPLRSTDFGVSYLRLEALARTPEAGALLIELVEMQSAAANGTPGD